MASQHTHIISLTRGTHRITPTVASEIRSAVEAGKPMIDIPVCSLGEDAAELTMSIATSHIIAIYQEPDTTELPFEVEPGGDNVTPLRRIFAR